MGGAVGSGALRGGGCWRGKYRWLGGECGSIVVMNEPQQKKSPGRPLTDPSGRKVSVGIGLSPRQIEILDREAETQGVSRSEYVGRLLERATGAAAGGSQYAGQHVSSNAGTVVHEVGCGHDSTEVIAGTGLKRCRECAAVQGKDKSWRKP